MNNHYGKQMGQTWLALNPSELVVELLDRRIFSLGWCHFLELRLSSEEDSLTLLFSTGIVIVHGQKLGWLVTAITGMQLQEGRMRLSYLSSRSGRVTFDDPGCQVDSLTFQSLLPDQPKAALIASDLPPESTIANDPDLESDL